MGDNTYAGVCLVTVYATHCVYWYSTLLLSAGPGGWGVGPVLVVPCNSGMTSYTGTWAGSCDMSGGGGGA